LYQDDELVDCQAVGFPRTTAENAEAVCSKEYDLFAAPEATIPSGDLAPVNGGTQKVAAQKSTDPSPGFDSVAESSSSPPRGHNCQWVGCSDRPAFRDGKALYEHLVEAHNEFPVGSPPLLCWWEPCNYFAPHPTAMRMHMLKHVEYYAYKCAYCKRQFKRNGDWHRHEKRCDQKIMATDELVTQADSECDKGKIDGPEA
jgi:DNA-directed RNA polymerase subunit RPC12/RpoP